MATTAASAVRIESRTGARLTREKIPPLAISPPGRRQEPLLYSPWNSESCGGDFILLPSRGGFGRAGFGFWGRGGRGGGGGGGGGLSGVPGGPPLQKREE